ERFRSRTPQTNRDPGQPQLSWDTPEGWSEKPGTDMRLANFTFGEQNEGEVYVVRLQGGGGGLLANVNRWRGQMGLPPISEEDVASLPKKLLFGLEATYVSMDGTFTGMGTEPKENYRMLGLILSSDIGAVFVKMTGPRELVAENEEKFDEFCQSLGLGVPGQ
ncbi:MAG: hypothetical protein HKN23_06420, partial [Verrucomicrobiales bacterium]|nr:hypothetical protein [Verrucomicrobiales bacterium]